MKILTNILGVFLTTFALAPAANATLIATGQIQLLTNATGGGNFSFSIGSVSASGHHDEGPRLLAGFEGGLFDGGQTVGVGAIEFFTGQLDDQFVFWNSHPVPVNPTPTHWTITAPGTVLTAGQTVYHSTFDFTGSLCASFSYNTPCDVVFPSLTGQGIAEYLFAETVLGDGRHYFTPTTATYTFTSVPEPGTFALFGMGLAIVAFMSKRGRRIRID